ncbi:Glutamate receptor ionotropic, kainate 4 isoform X2 [Aphelenchoides besseyi]|nr:Glutamate receptor ionotropic, kainate 4 isoform X2 [Aphelenchoides besseyi]
MLRVIYPDYFPMSNIISLIAKHINATIKVVSYDHRFTVDDILDEKNSFLGMYAQLQNDEADLMAYTVEATTHRHGYWDFSEPLYKSEVHIALKMDHKTLSSVFDFFSVYHKYTWLFMAVSFILFVVFGLIVRFVERRLNLRYSVGIYSHCWQYLRLQLLQPVDIQYRLRAGNISLIVFSFFQCALIISMYQSWILTSVMRIRKPPSLNFDDISEFLLSERYELASARPSAWYFEEILHSKFEPFRTLGVALRERAPRWVDSDYEALSLASTGEYMVFLQTDRHDRYLFDMFCDLSTIESPFPPMDEIFLMRKGNPWLPQINKAIKAQSYQIKRLFRKYIDYRAPRKCDPPNDKIKSLTLTPYYGVLLLLICGLICAGFVLILEIIFGLGDHEPNEAAIAVWGQSFYKQS